MFKNNSNKILNEIEKLKQSNLYNLESINDILSKIDITSLMNIDQKIKMKAITSKPDAEYEIANFDRYNNIIIYKNFFFVNYKIMEIFKKYFSESFNNKDISYLNYQNNDIISLTHHSQFTIYIGNIINERFFYEIKYILNFKDYSQYINQQNLLSKMDFKYYIENRTVFNKNKTNDFVSPIFSGNEVIGYFYKYLEGVNYNSCINYYNLLKNDKLINSILLFYYNQNFKKMVNESFVNTYYNKKYYLIDKKAITEMKTTFDFEKFIEKKYLNYSSIKNNNKEFLSLIKSLPDDFLLKFLDKDNNNIQNAYLKEKILPSIININYFYTTPKSIIIYDNFEIYDEDFIRANMYDIYLVNDCRLECAISKGKIIINQKNILNKDQYVLTIGKLNDNNTYITEYLIIYKESYSYHIDINKISRRLSQYMDDSQLQINDSGPIIDNEFKEVGTIVKYRGNNNYSNNNNNLNSNNYNNNFPNNNNNNSINNKNNNIINNEEQITKGNPADNKNNKSNFKVNKANIVDIKSYFMYPPLIGLQNIGATCYMNATLQCFCNIRTFINFFKYHKQAINIFKEDKKKVIIIL